MMCCLFIILIFRTFALENIGKNIEDWTQALHDPVMIKIRINNISRETSLAIVGLSKTAL